MSVFTGSRHPFVGVAPIRICPDGLDNYASQGNKRVLLIVNSESPVCPHCYEGGRIKHLICVRVRAGGQMTSSLRGMRQSPLFSKCTRTLIQHDQ